MSRRRPQPGPCECWSCGGECGGTTDALGSCGPAEDRAGHSLCVDCRDAADAFDVDRQGAKVRTAGLGDSRVVLDTDVFNTHHKLYFDPAEARALAAALERGAAEVEAAP